MKTFVTSSTHASAVVLDKKYRLIRLKVYTEKGRLTKKKNDLSEKMEKYEKQKGLSLMELRHIESLVQRKFKELDVVLDRLVACYEEIEALFYEREDLHKANHRLLDYTYQM